MDKDASLHILTLEPYYGGSHRAFVDGWADRSRHRFTLLTLPPHSWKWRMRHAAVTFAEQLDAIVADGESWDAVFCSDMLNLAEFRGLCPPSVARLPAVVYFHENQLTYPVRVEAERDLHFAYSNFTTCLSADAVWFNSAFHRDDFLRALRKLLRRMPDFSAAHRIPSILEKSAVQPPGVEAFPARGPRRPGPLRIIWAARWEHDKNPDDFFAALQMLMRRGVDFRVSVIGEQFRETPPVFGEIRDKLAGRIDRWGFQPSREDYRKALQEADVFVSTAHHEFFGIAAVEAMAAGCFPLLPHRLAYPELVAELPRAREILYDGKPSELAGRLQQLTRSLEDGNDWRERTEPVINAAARFVWQQRIPELDAAIESVASRSDAPVSAPS